MDIEIGSAVVIGGCEKIVTVADRILLGVNAVCTSADSIREGVESEAEA